MFEEQSDITRILQNEILPQTNIILQNHEVVNENTQKQWIDALHNELIFTLEDWKEVRAAYPKQRLLPLKLQLKLDEFAKSQKKKEDEEKEGEEELENNEAKKEEDPEELVQRKIVEQMAIWKEKGETHKMVAKIFLNNISNFNTAESSVYVDIGVNLWFFDEAHIGYPEGAPDYEKVWKPLIEFEGSIDMEPTIFPEFGGSYYIQEIHSPLGIVNFYNRYKGHIRQDLEENLPYFPFDRQTIKIRFGCPTSPAYAVMFLDFTDPNLLPEFKKTADNKLHEWQTIGDIAIENKIIWNLEDQRDISYIDVNIDVKRKSGYYFSNIFACVYFLDILFWWTFILDSDALADRLNIIIACFLAMVAFAFVIAETLPKISHSTYLSRFFFYNYIFAALGATESAFVYFLNDNHPDVAFIVDLIMLCSLVIIQTSLLLFYWRNSKLIPQSTLSSPKAKEE